MITLFYFIRLAIHNLLRGGQRVLVALLCVAFGIMALVSMDMIANTISSAVQLTPAQQIGGDISMGRKSEDFVRPEDIEQINSLVADHRIDKYTQISFKSSILFHKSGSGEMHFVGNGLGIEPEKYPLLGSLTIGEPGSIGLSTLLHQVGDAVVTREIAENYQLKVGDAIILADPRIGVPVEGTIRGIAYDTPNHRGDKIYYSLETAQAIANGQPVVNTIILTTADADALTGLLDQSGWSVDWTAGRMDGKTANLWVISLRGAGILGLLVGAIGISNTMLVLLRRRQKEIAVWKTLGYREGDLRLIFSLEAGLLGLAGSLLGAVCGAVISSGLLGLFQRTSNLLYAWIFSPAPVLLGVLVGTLTTVIFAYWAIVISSQARPMALLRNEPIDVQHLPGCQSAALGLLLAGSFTALTSLVMESVWAGVGVLASITIGMVLVGGFFNVLLWLITRLFPLRRFRLAHMAINSLRRRGLALIFAMIALLVGVLSMSLGLFVTQKSERDLAMQSMGSYGYNLNILSRADQESVIRQAVDTQNPLKVGIAYRTALAGLDGIDGQPVSVMDAVLVGRSDPDGYLISGAEWGSRPDGVYAYQWANLTAGSQVTATLRDGATHTFTVVGFYNIDHDSMNLYPPLGLLMLADTFKRVAQADSLTYFVQVAPDQLDRTSMALGARLPQATVLNLVTYAARFMQSYRNLYILPMALAGLALLSGILLVANSVSLAMLDRRYEIGILKTIGYTRGQILTIFAVEYGLVGLLAAGVGVFIIQGLLAVLAIGNHLPVVSLLLNLKSLSVIAFSSIGLTLLTVLGISWSPTQVPPLIVLNERS